MADDTQTTPVSTNGGGWMGDVQRALAIMLIGTFAILCVVTTISSIWLPANAVLTDMAKTLQQALVNLGLIAMGFFFGSTIAKAQADAGQQKIVEKLTSSAPPATGPVAPVPAPTVVVAWWSVLTDAERAAMDASTDPRVQAFITGAQLGKATVDDLTYLVGAGLLTQERATAIQST